MSSAADLRKAGLKATLPRLKILEIFESSESRHMSAEDVFKVLLEQGADIGLATVYRVLMQFEQAGILKRTSFDVGKAVFELDAGEHHDHLVCLQCGAVEEFLDPAIEKRQEQIAQEHGFELTDHALALYGICKDCRSSGSRH